jgi:flavin reductase (DIM6/NTAB) family NADH-FMN oxidoreductase RutF
MGRLFYPVKELLRRPRFPGMPDPTHLYYHFRPARPANLLVTRDILSGELNLAAGTYGLLTERPYTIGLHISKHSFDSARNVQAIGTECVVPLPGPDLVRETWFTSLPIPRGIFEGEIGGLTLLPSRVVSVPGIAECPVNLECLIERVIDWHTHYAVFLRVVGASVDETLLQADRLAVIRRFPTYEVDDQTNAFGGSIERLGVNGELLTCPGFPVGARQGEQAGTAAWIEDLRAGGYLADAEVNRVIGWVCAWEEAIAAGEAAQQEPLRRSLTRALELAAWEAWDELHAYLAEEG